jgi:hypothetical protein
VILLAFAAAALSPPKMVSVFGAGHSSCAKAWTDENYAQSYVWLMGFWSGMNTARSAQTGHGTDGDGVVGEVKLICAKTPSLPLISAAAEAYNAMSLR